jgi:hypothetical protein
VSMIVMRVSSHMMCMPMIVMAMRVIHSIATGVAAMRAKHRN